MAELPAYPVLPDWIASAIGSSSYRDRTVSLRAEPELLALPADVLMDLIAFMKCEDVLKLRLASSQAKRFIEETIPSIYARMRKINPMMPVIKFLQAEPGETAVQRTRRAKKNVLLFRNECMLAHKTEQFAPIYSRRRFGRHEGLVQDGRLLPLRWATPRREAFQQMWWEYLIYLKNGLKHEHAFLAVRYKIPLSMVKKLTSQSEETQRAWWHELKSWPWNESGSRGNQLRDMAKSGKALDVYDPQMTAGKILASIRLELMTTGEMQEFLTRHKVPGRSKLQRKEDRKAAIAKYIRENIR